MADISNNTYWSETDSLNNTASPNGFKEGMAPSAVNDSARAFMGAVKRSWDRNNAVKTSTGSLNAYIVTYDVSPSSLGTGERYMWTSNHTNTGASTLQINALTAVTIKRLDGSDLSAGDIVSGYLIETVYNGTNFVLISSLGTNAYDRTNVAITGGSITGITDLAIGDGGTGASDAATARTNLGFETITYYFRNDNGTGASTSRLPSTTGLNIGGSSNRWNTVYATTFDGTATQAQYADLAERYESDMPLQPGDVVKIGGAKEVTKTTQPNDVDVFGVVSTNPAHLMNSQAGECETHPAIALTGRVPCKVVGTVQKGQRLVSSATPGVAVAANPTSPFSVIGRALETKTSKGIGLVEIAIGKL